MSGKQALLELLKQQKQQGTEGKADAKRRLQEWRHAINELFHSIETWLKPAVDQNLLRIDRRKTTVSEWQLGDYESPVLVITAPNGRHVEAIPKGRDIVGGEGRVDLESGADRLILIRSRGSKWDFTTRHANRVERIPLSEESLSDCLRELFE